MKNHLPSYLCALGTFLMLMSGCASSGPSQPAWISNPNAELSNDDYMVAVGSGSTLEIAKDKGYDNLARMFSVEISSETNLQTSEEQQRDASGLTMTGSTQLDRSITSMTDETIQNARIFESHFSKSDQTHYALVGLNRSDTGRLIRKQMMDNQMDVEQHIARSKESEDPVMAIAHLNKASQLMLENDVLENQYSVISQRSRPSLSEFTKSDLNDAIAEAKKQAVIYCYSDDDIGGDRNTELLNTLKTVYTKNGFSVTDNRSSANLTSKISSSVEPAPSKRENFTFYAWTLRITLSQDSSGEVYTEYSKRSRDGGSSPEMAMLSVRKYMKENIESEFQKHLNNTVLSLD